MTTDVAVTDAEGMNPEVKLLWVNALRSGEFDQATGVLANVDSSGKVDGYCCLGVLCEIAAREGVIEPGQVGNIYDEVPSDGDAFRQVEGTSARLIYGDLSEPKTYRSRSSTELPDVVRQWAGLKESIPEVWVDRDPEDIEFDRREFGLDEPRTQERNGVAELNDGGTSFHEIADLIERDL